MKEKWLRIAKPFAFIGLALVVAGSFLAASGDGQCPLKAAKAAGAACEGGACPMAAKAAKAESCEGGVCPVTGKAVAKADCEAGACPMSAKMAKNSTCEGGACPSKDIVSTALEDGSFSTLLLAARAAGMMDALTCPQPKTLLAPTNEAFQKIPAEKWAALLQDDAALRALIGRHIISGAIPAAELSKQELAKASNGEELCVKHCNVSGKTTVGTANIVKADIAASNGYIQAIDSVLLPENPAVAAAEKTESPDGIHVASAK